VIYQLRFSIFANRFLTLALKFFFEQIVTDIYNSENPAGVILSMGGPITSPCTSTDNPNAFANKWVTLVLFAPSYVLSGAAGHG
jgi:hypothetical protein